MGIAGKSSFGNNVRRLRESSGMTQENLAEAAGLDRSYIGGIERGERNPALAAILRLASALGIAPAELFNGIGGNRQNVARSILDRWDFTDEDLTQLIDGNPSLRGMALGYLAELKLERLWLSDPRFSEVSKHDDHDRGHHNDRVAVYKGREFTLESKSLQTSTVQRTPEGWVGRAQVDASDRREVALPDGSTMSTTCLLRGEFDILAVNLFAFGDEWRFSFARNSDLPGSRYSRYSEYQRQHLLATMVDVSWPPQPPFRADLFELLDEMIDQA